MLERLTLGSPLSGSVRCTAVAEGRRGIAKEFGPAASEAELWPWGLRSVKLMTWVVAARGFAGRKRGQKKSRSDTDRESLR